MESIHHEDISVGSYHTDRDLTPHGGGRERWRERGREGESLSTSPVFCLRNFGNKMHRLSSQSNFLSYSIYSLQNVANAILLKLCRCHVHHGMT